MARTPQHTVRVPDDLWEAAQAVAKRRGETMSAAMVRFLMDYADFTPAAPPEVTVTARPRTVASMARKQAS